MGENQQRPNDLGSIDPLDDCIETLRERLLRAAHQNMLMGLIRSNHHRPRDCPKRAVRQDPPMCPMCSPLMRTYEELDYKLKDEIWFINSHLLDPAMEMITKLYDRLQLLA